MDRSLMAEIDVLANCESLRVLVGQDGRPGGLGLTDSISGPGIVQENIVDTARVPGIYAVCTSEAGIADKRVTASVIVSSIVVGAIVILL